MSARPGFTATCTALLRGGESVRFRATGRSMAPAIRDGDLLTVSRAEPETIRPGDVVLYPGVRGLLAHRVAEIDGGSFRVQGDAIGSDLEVVAPDWILGRVVAVNGDPPAPRASRRFGARLLRVSARVLAAFRASVSGVTGPGGDPGHASGPRVE